MPRVRFWKAGLAVLMVALAPESGPLRPAAAAEPLPSFNVDQDQTTVSGLSSGAYMAGQFHVAFSQSVHGAAIVAGGPYFCAEGGLTTALNRCMTTALGTPDAARLLETARGFARQQRIDPLDGLAGDRVYVFGGTRDETVVPRVVDETAAFYRLAGLPEEAIKHVDDMAAGHGFIVEETANRCAVTESPFINDCDYDQAGDLLQHLYGTLNPPADAQQGTLVAFDQRAFLPDPTAHGMAEDGFLYVPPSCGDGASCRVHIAFHGCKQTTDHVGRAFVTGTGLNRWAEANDMIVLYPQAHPTLMNPNACWDWWGYDDADYATRAGRQMAAVKGMLDQLAGVIPPEPAFCRRWTDTNLTHWQADRAEICNWWFLCANGSGDNLGFPFSTTTLFEHPQGNFTLTACEG